MWQMLTPMSAWVIEAVCSLLARSLKLLSMGLLIGTVALTNSPALSADPAGPAFAANAPKEARATSFGFLVPADEKPEEANPQKLSEHVSMAVQIVCGAEDKPLSDQGEDYKQAAMHYEKASVMAKKLSETTLAKAQSCEKLLGTLTKNNQDVIAANQELVSLSQGYHKELGQSAALAEKARQEYRENPDSPLLEMAAKEAWLEYDRMQKEGKQYEAMLLAAIRTDVVGRKLRALQFSVNRMKAQSACLRSLAASYHATGMGLQNISEAFVTLGQEIKIDFPLPGDPQKTELTAEQERAWKEYMRGGTKKAAVASNN